MFWIVILHKTVIGQLLSYEWDQRGFQDAAEELSIHDTIKDTNLGGTISANPGPNMYFQRMLWFGLALRRLVNLSVAGAPILLQGNGAFIGKDHVVKCRHFPSRAEHTPIVSPCWRLV